MTANELIGLIPRHVFRELSAKTKIDHLVKKLTGEVMFKLILFSMLSINKLSLRVMETLLQACSLKLFAITGNTYRRAAIILSEIASAPLKRITLKNSLQLYLPSTANTVIQKD